MGSENTAAGMLDGRAGGRNSAANGGGRGHSFDANCTSGAVQRQVWVGGRNVGFVAGDTYRKQVHTSMGHMLQKPPAWAIADSVLAEAEELGARTVEIEDLDTGRVWRAPLRAFREHGFRVHRGRFEPQTGLTLNRWHLVGSAPQAELEPQPKRASEEPLTAQLALF